MIERSSDLPPYRFAALAGALVLVVYLATLAPTVTFWDAGELIAAAYSLGIPHPPGTPVYVIIAHVWGLLIPFGDYAWRLNLLSAVCGAVSAGCWFLVAHSLMRRLDQRLPRGTTLGVGAAAAALTAFNFTTWQNAVEAEVYAVALLLIALAAWGAVRWCEIRGDRRGPRLLLGLLFLGGLSVGNHLLGLLVGPAAILLLASESYFNPLAEPVRRRTEHARIAVIAAIWALLIALGLGSASLAVLTGLLALGALALAVRRRQTGFALAAIVLGLVAVSPYLFLLLRARQSPFINEADPATFDALIAVIRRAQYPIRTPLDDPTALHGPQNLGRTLTMLGYQIANYAQYFDWQWARGLGHGVLTAWPRLLVTGGAVWLGLLGLVATWRRDRSGAAFLVALFAVTGFGLVLYMNFKPGPSIGWERWPLSTSHEVRERDYFFVVSFVAWGVAMALGLGHLARRVIGRWPGVRGTNAIFALALVPMVFNFGAASRRSGVDATLARDFSRALLQSVPPGGILFTWGDNDTFPLWHAQVVDGVRRDVTIVCLALAETPWYQRQLRDRQPPPADRNRLAVAWRGVPDPEWNGPIHSLSDSMIFGFVPQLADREYELSLGALGRMVIPKGSELYAKDILLLSVVSTNAGHRPIAWSVSAMQKLYDAPVVQQGLALVLPIHPGDFVVVDSTASMGPGTLPIDVAVTTSLMDSTWSFGGLVGGDIAALDPNIAAMARTIALPYTRLGIALLERSDTVAAIRRLNTAAQLAPSQPAIAAFVAELRAGSAVPGP